MLSDLHSRYKTLNPPRGGFTGKPNSKSIVQTLGKGAEVWNGEDAPRRGMRGECHVERQPASGVRGAAGLRVRPEEPPYLCAGAASGARGQVCGGHRRTACWIRL